MNEYVINFINDQGVYQQLTFRGVSEAVAFALAKGLLDASFDQVSLSAKEFVDREITILGVDAPTVSDQSEGASGASGASGEPASGTGGTGPSEGASGATGSTGSSGSSGASGSSGK